MISALAMSPRSPRPPAISRVIMDGFLTAVSKREFFIVHRGGSLLMWFPSHVVGPAADTWVWFRSAARPRPEVLPRTFPVLPLGGGEGPIRLRVPGNVPRVPITVPVVILKPGLSERDLCLDGGMYRQMRRSGRRRSRARIGCGRGAAPQPSVLLCLTVILVISGDTGAISNESTVTPPG